MRLLDVFDINSEISEFNKMKDLSKELKIISRVIIDYNLINLPNFEINDVKLQEQYKILYDILANINHINMSIYELYLIYITFTRNFAIYFANKNIKNVFCDELVKKFEH